MRLRPGNYSVRSKFVGAKILMRKKLHLSTLMPQQNSDFTCQIKGVIIKNPTQKTLDK